MMSEEGMLCRGKWEPAPRRWFVFGEGGGTCEISDGEDQVMLHLPQSMVSEVLKARDRSVDAWMEWAKKQPRGA